MVKEVDKDNDGKVNYHEVGGTARVTARASVAGTMQLDTWSPPTRLAVQPGGWHSLDHLKGECGQHSAFRHMVNYHEVVGMVRVLALLGQFEGLVDKDKDGKVNCHVAQSAALAIQRATVAVPHAAGHMLHELGWFHANCLLHLDSHPVWVCLARCIPLSAYSAAPGATDGTRGLGLRACLCPWCLPC